MPRLSLLLLPALLAACTPMAPPATDPTTTPVTVSDVTQVGFPMRTYTTTIVASDIPAGAPAELAAGISGAWTIAFGSNGHALVTYNGQQMVDAPFTVNGNQLVMGADDTGEYACHSAARYTWHATSTELHLVRVEDSCDGRPVVLTAHALVVRP